ncbi:19736_t:CDS:2 [Funneliformis geosporum]|uniref:19736_t:CDS:1 n=1 Tax=Funneliformis geosporum TaxID=1117311 RepID=A0A9W4SCN4_9GLOM|nr:19736_t:CDS:2 [Funneliformis geosporum]
MSQVKTDFTFNVSFDEYTTAVNAVKSIQEDNESVHTDPNLPRAKDFFSTDEIGRLMSMTRSAIQEEREYISKSAESFLEALLLSEIISLQLLAKECGARGVAGIHDLLQKSADKMQDAEDRKIVKIIFMLSLFSDATERR